MGFCKNSIFPCFIGTQSVWVVWKGKGLRGDFCSTSCSGSLVKWNQKKNDGDGAVWHRSDQWNHRRHCVGIEQACYSFRNEIWEKQIHLNVLVFILQFTAKEQQQRTNVSSRFTAVRNDSVSQQNHWKKQIKPSQVTAMAHKSIINSWITLLILSLEPLRVPLIRHEEHFIIQWSLEELFFFFLGLVLIY